MFAIRLVHSSWYTGHNSAGVGMGPTPDEAKRFETRAEAESGVLLLVTAYPQWIGRVTIKRIKAIEIQVRKAHTTEWREKIRDGKTIRVPAKTFIECKTVTKYVVKR